MLLFLFYYYLRANHFTISKKVLYGYILSSFYCCKSAGVHTSHANSVFRYTVFVSNFQKFFCNLLMCHTPINSFFIASKKAMDVNTVFL